VIRAVARHGAVTGLWRRSLPENPRPSDGMPSRPARCPLTGDMAVAMNNWPLTNGLASSSNSRPVVSGPWFGLSTVAAVVRRRHFDRRDLFFLAVRISSKRMARRLATVGSFSIVIGCPRWPEPSPGPSHRVLPGSRRGFPGGAWDLWPRSSAAPPWSWRRSDRGSPAGVQHGRRHYGAGNAPAGTAAPSPWSCPGLPRETG
jgi:hypothetical protein